MDDVVIAPNEDDQRAARAIEQHHAQLAAELTAQVERLVQAAAEGRTAEAGDARRAVVDWSRRELVPHALAEEGTLYTAAHGRPEGTLLVDGMIDEHRRIVALLDQVETATDIVRAAAAGHALLTLFESHLAKENELVVPLLIAAPDVQLSTLLGGMEELLGAEAADHDHDHGHDQGGHAHGCTCGEAGGSGVPELDTRTIPHAIRHATIFGALDALAPGGGIVLIASHNPIPLLAQLEARAPETFAVEYLEEGPEIWRLALVRATDDRFLQVLS